MEGLQTNNWYYKLLGFGVPVQIANRMSYDLNRLGYSSEQFNDINMLVASLQQDNRVVQLDWWDDLMNWLNQLLQLLPQITPGIVMTIAGGAIVYFLRNVKIRNIPIGLVGLIPLGYGIWNIMQPFIYPQQ